MTFVLALALLVASGLALLRLLGLGTGSRAADLALGWLAGSGAFALAAPIVRFGIGIPLSRATALALVALPVAAWALRRRLRRRYGREGRGGGGGGSPPHGDLGDEPPAAPRGGASRPGDERAAAPGRPGGAAGAGIAPPGAGATGVEGAAAESAGRPRAGWMPGAAWAFAPMAAYVAIVGAAVLLHGLNTPTHTDDGVRVRAFAPVLAFAGGWEPEARAILLLAGPLPTFVPALGWILTGSLDHFHVNYFVLTELAALLTLAVSVAVSRGEPERGWASAFAILSAPLFVYHCTSTYSDAVLAARVAGGVLFAIEYARTGEGKDASRALLLLGLAALVKREGEIVAAAPAAVLVTQIAWERSRGAGAHWSAVAALAVPVALGVLVRIAAAGLDEALPILGVVARRSAGTSPAAPAPPGGGAAAFFFEAALFRSGNAGVIFWLLAATVAVRARALLGIRPRPGGGGPSRSRLLWPLAGVLALLGEAAVSSIWLVPEYTLDQSTVHRALMAATVPAAIWVAAALTEAVREDALDAAAAARGRGAKTTPPRRRRDR